MNRDELAQALQTALRDNIGDSQGFKTTAELMDELGWGKDKVLRRLRFLKKNGELEIGDVYLENLAGNMQIRKAYRFVSKDGHKE